MKATCKYFSILDFHFKSFLNQTTENEENNNLRQRSDEQVRYRSNTPLVLKGLSLSIRGGEKIGVVGRTGSGKSTLIQVFFRLVEPCGGKIIIDGVDICKMGLHDLRSRFGIIPQEPVLFQGTVRTNVDPLGLYSEEEIWKVFTLSSDVSRQ